MLGSAELVEHGLGRHGLEVRLVHVLEMLGFTSDTQRVPPGVPVAAPPDGRFLGLLAKDDSNRELRRIGQLAREVGLPTVGLQTWFGVDRWFPDLHRSDHGPFWAAEVPAVMWTDSASHDGRACEVSWARWSQREARVARAERPPQGRP